MQNMTYGTDILCNIELINLLLPCNCVILYLYLRQKKTVVADASLCPWPVTHKEI